MQNNPIDNPRVEALKDWARLHVQNTERDLTKTLFAQALSHSETMERFSNWLLLLVGAAFSLLLANLEAVTRISSPTAIQWLILLFVLSALCGFVEKSLAMAVDFKRQVSEALEREWTRQIETADKEEEEIKRVAEQTGIAVDTRIDPVRLITPLLLILPQFMRKRMVRKMTEGMNDPLSTYKDAGREMLRQSIWLFAQLLFVIGGAVVLAMNINGG